MDINGSSGQNITDQPITFQQPSNILMALDWLMQNPSIPLDIKKEFHMMWENVVFGCYDEKDRLFLMSKFREWTIDKQMSVPEQQWGNPIEYNDIDSAGNVKTIRMDYNQLFDMLESMYFIQISRGKDGFTLKEMNTSRQYLPGNNNDQNKKKKVGWF